MGSGWKVICITNYSSQVTIDAGAGDDIIENWDVNVTITSGAGNDTISFDGSSRGTTITDFDASDKLDLMYYEPTFAKFANNMLNISNYTKVKLPNVKNINDYRDMIVSYYHYDEETGVYTDAEMEITLGELLDAPAPYWKVSGTTATYYDGDGKLLVTLTGLKSGLKAVNGEIAGIDVDYVGAKIGSRYKRSFVQYKRTRQGLLFAT